MRSAYAGITALILSFVIGPHLIRWLKSHNFVAGAREKSLANQHNKKGTPTMGGILILISIVVPTLLWAKLTEPFIHLILFLCISLGMLGLCDDMRKIKQGKGLRPLFKFIWQIAIAICIGIYVILFPKDSAYTTSTSFMFLKNTFLYLGCFYIVFVIFVLVGTSNATNLTDGLDGLSIGLVAESAVAFAVLAYIVGNVKMSSYLNILYIPGSGELTIFLSSAVGASLGFLWFNTHPAELFMGDTGALALGGSIGGCAVFIKQEILLLLVGGVFVIEALSVMLQVMYFKKTGGKRFFKMSPLHHHFEKLGIPENRIVVRFWIVGILFDLAAFSTLKIR